MTTQLAQPLLSLRFEGKATKDNTILWDDLSQFVSNLDSAIQRVINVLETGTSLRVGRPTRAFQALTALEVVGVGRGSFVLGLTLRRDQDLLPGFDTGVQAISRLIGGLNEVAGNMPLPEGFDRGVLMALREAGRVLDRGIDTVEITPSRLVGQTGAAFAHATRERIVAGLHSLAQAWAEAEGRLLMADVKEDSLRCRLHPSTGDPLLCSFPEEMALDIMGKLRQFVRIRGEATVDPSTDRIRSFMIRDLEAIEEPSQPAVAVAPLSTFWEPRGFDDLAAEQGVYPVEDLTLIAGGWPQDADFDSFLEAIRTARIE